MKTSFTSLQAYLEHKEVSDLPLSELNHQFITGYEVFVKSVRNVEHNTAIGTIKKLKKIVRICVANDWLAKDPFSNYKIKLRDTNRPVLLKDERDRILSLGQIQETITCMRDMFAFSCYTGLAYADVEKLRRTDVVVGDDRQRWIHTHRTKTEPSTSVPLLPLALKIIKAYKNHPICENEGKLLPVR